MIRTPPLLRLITYADIFYIVTGGSKTEDLRTEKILDVIYTTVCNNSPSGLCAGCPVVQLIRTVRDSMWEKNNQRVASELDIGFSSAKCPCLKEFEDLHR